MNILKGAHRLMVGEFFSFSKVCYKCYTPNANMADHLVGARDKFHESEASEVSVFCFDNQCFP